MSRGRRIVLTTHGTLGDLHPYLAIALELRARGHRPVVATGEYHRRHVEAAGVEFHAVRPDSSFENKELHRRLTEPRRGLERVIREFMLPVLRETYDDLLEVAPEDGGADLMVSQLLIFAARRLGRRAVLLVGRDTPNELPRPLPENILAVAYAPYARIFPRASVVVHQGGVGTTGQALRAGRPMLVMPCGGDQFDNGARVAPLGAGRTMTRKQYTAGRDAVELKRLLDDPKYVDGAAELGRRVRAEDGVRVACDALEEEMRKVTGADGRRTERA